MLRRASSGARDGGRRIAPPRRAGRDRLHRDQEVAAAPILRVIGTAGHVDHGKSTLITALTGIDPDRLAEERARGMTIDLGFAWLTIPAPAGAIEIGIVDVPGHQDFIRNMLAGVGSIDAVVLVVALNEGVMSQTREHLAILSLLGVDRGVVALTKRDLVDDEWAALATADVRAAVAGTPLAAAPFVEVSARTGAGLGELRAAIGETLGALAPRRDAGRPRLAIDRAFTMTGFGTVVTGTLIDGELAIGDDVAIVPGGRTARIRGMQTHRRAVERAVPGSRVALNLVGVEKDELARGMVLVRPGTLEPSSLAGLRLRLLPSAGWPLHHDELVKVHTGTSEVMARVSLLEGTSLELGAQAWAQLRLAEPVGLAVGDRAVVRRPSPGETLGGGVITDLGKSRLRRRADVISALERRSAPGADARLLAALDAPRTAEEAGARAGLGLEERDRGVALIVEDGRAIRLGDALLSREAYDVLATRVMRMLAMAHRVHPLRSGAPREEVRVSSGLAARRFADLVARLVAAGAIAERGAALALAAHVPALDVDEERAWARARSVLDAAPLQPPSVASLGLEPDVLGALVERGDLVRVADALFLPDAVARFAAVVLEEIRVAGRISVARARDLSGSSRKHVLPLLGFLDGIPVTRRVGDDRVLVYDASEARARVSAALGKGEARS